MKSDSVKNGFTLLELLVVVAILGVLFSIAMPQYTAYTLRANRQDAFSILTAIRFAQEGYKADNGTYSADLTLLGYDSAQESVDGLYVISAAACADSTIAQCVVLTATPKAGESQVNDKNGAGGVITINTRLVKTGGWK
ncbi:type IV pilin protein [Oceanicoccus sagamiensis]|uniref:Pilus assembly protein PilE n=1 Tax=Oceanicoccus sagamiensis TaxID=716816 RepID=A0A1X9ND39_9GAMM|nr:type IV pilin protein [Oceanicoccus sagamiensis]ARN75476.1 hypothetical protein BST96_15980 [Oceanicoccus sagamiensis]